MYASMQGCKDGRTLGENVSPLSSPKYQRPSGFDCISRLASTPLIASWYLKRYFVSLNRIAETPRTRGKGSGARGGERGGGKGRGGGIGRGGEGHWEGIHFALFFLIFIKKIGTCKTMQCQKATK